MDATSKAKWQIRAAALAIFLLGFVGGALTLNVYHKRQATAQSGRPQRFEQALERLNLTPEQKTQVEKILADARAQLAEMRRQSAPQFREIRRQSDERLKAVLTPEQWEQFRQFTEEMRSRRRGPGSRRGGDAEAPPR
jgi:Spy/CpxP family protein refolding chaperone